MKKYLVIFTLLITALASFAQNNEIRIIGSSDFLEPIDYDYLPQVRSYSIGLEYSKSVSKRFDVETGLMYSQSGFKIVHCEDCFFWWPHYMETKEINTKLGLKWRFIEKEKIGFYTSLGIQGNLKLAPKYDFGIPEENHLSAAVYQDIGIRFKINRSFSIDFELKGRYNLPNDSGIYYYRDDLQIGAGIGFNYSF